MNLELKKNLSRYLKYCIVGGIGAITDFSIFTVLIKFFLINYLLANILSITVALIIVYLLQKNWTFQYSTSKNTKTIQRYLVSVAITYLLNNGVLIVLVETFGYNVIISKVIQVILSTVWGYCLTNYFVFNTRWEKLKK
jgi:putative flippase GtrA